jgi:hypothetical protein
VEFAEGSKRFWLNPREIRNMPSRFPSISFSRREGAAKGVPILASLIGDCILVTREAKKLSQGDIEKRTDLNCCYISRVKHGHTVPSLEHDEF